MAWTSFKNPLNPDTSVTPKVTFKSPGYVSFNSAFNRIFKNVRYIELLFNQSTGQIAFKPHRHKTGKTKPPGTYTLNMEGQNSRSLVMHAFARKYITRHGQFGVTIKKGLIIVNTPTFDPKAVPQATVEQLPSIRFSEPADILR